LTPPRTWSRRPTVLFPAGRRQISERGGHAGAVRRAGVSSRSTAGAGRGGMIVAFLSGAVARLRVHGAIGDPSKRGCLG
jgi:hypothetical protein